MQTLRYNYRLKPTPEQGSLLQEFASYARGVWNLMLSENMRRYQYDKTFVFYNDMAGLLKSLKSFEEFNWLKSFDSASAQQVCKTLDTAIKRACSKTDRARFPRHKVTYKKKKLHNDSFPIINTNNSVRLENRGVKILKIGLVPIILHRKLVSTIKSASVHYTHGKWYISFVQEVEPKQLKKSHHTAVGCDINSKNIIVTSSGKTFSNPKFLKQSKEKLAYLQRQFARRKKGSVRWNITKNRINTLHGLVSRQRHDLHHKIAYAIAKSADVVICEDLNVRGMQRFNGTMVADNAMGGITSLISYKSTREGNVYHEIGRFEKSTGVCYSCNHVHYLTLKQRRFECEACHTENDRDLSAAFTIRRKGLQECIADGKVAWVPPTSQQKSLIKTKVSKTVEFGEGSEKILAA
jgi:putative transposase